MEKEREREEMDKSRGKLNKFDGETEKVRSKMIWRKRKEKKTDEDMV